ncbi:54S ribosomal protein L3, mitochondrial [Fulvia fulva]|uniref:Large ribosomal subunit protein mL44 n=1 Tax=Passalora fulva TaxID=5499 RepID=A0A9Q8LB09_PASFU|nr:54S ribosomal protein L3, mitochondrial [Fulvia fulva]KAK4632968.1 54S ribosomal protein L3, mitochondrial [Fulvia fulva]UJO14065.1 54S ribosomal protein L3, mitochondrial [Fulvia fulva]WPV12001.1 54S ribosomal protein L3, mitochondrial [Fulvia fulva]
MKSLRLDRWASQLQPPRNPRLYLFAQRCPFSTAHETRPRRNIPQQHQQAQSLQPQKRNIDGRRHASNAAAVEQNDALAYGEEGVEQQNIPPNFPRHREAVKSAKLSALHARLQLPSKLPLQTLARCLIDPSVDARPGYNNAPLALLGQELLSYYTSEHIICHYPRLPMPVLFAAQYAYVGPPTLAALRGEWGVEVVAAPGPEVDPGLLQLKRTPAGNALDESGTMRLKDMPGNKRIRFGLRNDEPHYRRGMSSRIIHDDEFGDLRDELSSADERAPFPGAPSAEAGEGAAAEVRTQQQDLTPRETQPETVQNASARFIRALTGALYLHAGTEAAKSFHKAHILSRHLKLHELFNFTHPTRDLSRLCAREGFEPPVARLISETGRLSRTPVFVIGVFSGNDKLGEGTGASLNEGRIRAAAAALRAWYLYSPPDTEIVVPSDVEGGHLMKRWKPQMVDMGEILT